MQSTGFVTPCYTCCASGGRVDSGSKVLRPVPFFLRAALLIELVPDIVALVLSLSIVASCLLPLDIAQMEYMLCVATVEVRSSFDFCFGFGCVDCCRNSSRSYS
jgi:hypothetical protein